MPLPSSTKAALLLRLGLCIPSRNYFYMLMDEYQNSSLKFNKLGKKMMPP
jgi:hypothetical protein